MDMAKGADRFASSASHLEPNLVPGHWLGRGGGSHITPPVLSPTPPRSFNQIGEREMPQITWGPPCQADGARGRGRDGAGDTLTYGVVSCDPV